MAYTVTVPAPAPAPIPRWVELLGVAAAAGAALGMASFVLRGVDGARMFELWVPHNGGVGLLGSALALVALRRNPQNRCVQAIFVASVTAGVHVAATAIADARIAQRPGLRQDLAAGAVALVELPADVAWPLWLMTWIWIVSASFLVVIAMLLVPYGRLPSRRWRPGLWVAFAGIAVTAAGYAWGNRPWSPYRLVFNEAPLADPVAAVLVTVGLPLLGAAALVTAASLIVRLRTAPSDERRQVRPVAVAAALTAVTYAALWPWQPVWAVTSMLGAWLLLGALLLGVLRARLFDVEVVVRRALVVALMAGFVTASYVAGVIGLGGLFGLGSDLWLSVAVTAAIAVTFEPVRRWGVRWSNRLVFGKHATPHEVLSRLSDRLARADSTDEVLAAVTQLLLDGTGAMGVEIWLGTGPGRQLAQSAGRMLPDGAVRRRTVEHAGEVLGAVLLSADRDDRFTGADERLLTDVAAALGLVLRNVRLTSELQRRIAELDASRRRLVTAHDDARRRLERDIHDGAQQHLLALRIKLGLGTALADQLADGRLDAVLREAATDTDRAIRELRDLARGLFPPVLAEHGLTTALRSYARSVPVPTTLHDGDIGRHDRQIEAAVYFCCTEAMQNASRHADAANLAVELVVAGGTLVFRVVDDGRGFDAARHGSGAGLANMRDRLTSLGGRLDIDSRLGEGTVVTGCVPLRDPAAPPQSEVSAR